MNSYWFFILLLLPILEWGWHLWIEWLNWKSFPKAPPEELSGWIQPHQYTRSRLYYQQKVYCSLLQQMFFLILGLWFFLGQGAVQWDNWIFTHLSQHPILQGLFFSFSLILVLFLCDLPFAYYRTFRIEEQFGFNRTPSRLFWIDRIKILLLLIMIGIPAVAALLWFLSYTSHPFLWGFLFIVGFNLISLFLAPVLIFPLFYKFTPIQNETLRNKILEYARKNHFQLTNVFEMNGSSRSTKANAFFVGFGPFKRVVLFDTLLQQLTEDEIMAVFAHEVGHQKEKHIWILMISNFLQLGLLFILAQFFFSHTPIFYALGFSQPKPHIGLWLIPFWAPPLNLLFSLILNAISRYLERRADRFASLTLTNGALHLESALKKLYANTFHEIAPHWLKVLFEYSHPPLLERIHHLQRYNVSTPSTSSSTNPATIEN